MLNPSTIFGKDTYSVGDIVLYPYNNEGYLIHRVIAIEDEGNIFICRGDNVKRKERVLKDGIIGVLTKAMKGEVCICERGK